MTLLELLHLLKQKWPLVVLLPLLFAGLTAGYCWGFMTNDYTSSVSLYVLSKSDSNDSSSPVVTSSDMTASQQLANDIAVLAKSNRVITTTTEALGMTTFHGYTIDVNSATTNRVITLSVTGKKPEAVALIADELARQTADTAVEIMDLKAVNIVDSAQIPTTPSGPNRILYLGAAFLAGLLAAIVLIVVLDLVNTKIRNPEEAETLLGLPILGRMPALKGKGD
jgi:capsular polysaccharide biosynthesis protein